ncbi:CBN-CLEC-100 protein [Caenorhabditis brenneri]|uniref:CBN-CLEC-100 protein n=1 Tax=Caenorhabditis brenneri TaxID=135651 RepID=G0NFS4_CAEBE|nr:CBN-CLEC-100 protein [Caenorhabditis brenneri]
MTHLKLLVGFSILLTVSAADFGDSSCDSSEEHGGGGHGGRPPRPPGPRPPRPPGPPGPAPPSGPDNSNRPRCEQGWYTSYRPQGIWCFRVGIGKMDYNGAISECATYGGVLSGIQNEWERWRMAEEALRQTAAYNVQYAGIWLGAQRVNGAFQWTDGHTTGTGGMVFGPGQPDNNNMGGRGPENCLQMIALAPGYWNNPGTWAAWTNGMIDDQWCNQVDDPPTRMYVCGKRGPQG